MVIYNRRKIFPVQLGLFISRHGLYTSVGRRAGHLHSENECTCRYKRPLGACEPRESPDIRFGTFLLATNPTLHFVFPHAFIHLLGMLVLFVMLLRNYSSITKEYYITLFYHISYSSLNSFRAFYFHFRFI